MTNEELVKCIQSGADPDAMEQLYRQNIPFIQKLAMSYAGYAEMEDLLQEAYFGLYEAVQHYEDDKEVLFLSYASYWIKQAMHRYARSCCQSVRIPEGTAEKVAKYRRFMSDFRQFYGQEPPRPLIRMRLGLGEQSLRHIEKTACIGKIQSLDESLKVDEDLTLADTVSSGEDMAGDVVDDIVQEELRRELWGMVDSLEGNQPAILHDHYERGMSLQVIGDMLGLSRERIRQLEVQAMRVLRRPKYACRLRPYLNDQEIATAFHGSGVGSFNRTWTSSTERVALHRMGEA